MKLYMPSTVSSCLISPTLRVGRQLQELQFYAPFLDRGLSLSAYFAANKTVMNTYDGLNKRGICVSISCEFSSPAPPDQSLPLSLQLLVGSTNLPMPFAGPYLLNRLQLSNSVTPFFC